MFLAALGLPLALLDGGSGLGLVAALGYDAWWDCIPASAVGAPHRRDRLWIVAYPRGVEHEGYGDALRRQIAVDKDRYAPREELNGRCKEHQVVRIGGVAPSIPKRTF